MGYETRMFVVSLYPFKTKPPMGEQLAELELCKCGNGPVSKLISSRTRRAPKEDVEDSLLRNLNTDIPFAIYPRNPQRQYAAVKLLRELWDNQIQGLSLNPQEINSLSNDIEDGIIYKDAYGDYLGVFEIDEFVTALKADLEIENYRRFQWALTLLLAIQESYKNGELRVITYGH